MKPKSRKLALPWEEWELDKTFFRELAQYSVDHPESTLDRILDSVKIGLEQHKELFEVIPNSPFPAQGLVKALAHLIKLGISVTRAKANVQQFTETVVSWVLEVKSAFLSSEGFKFTWATWRHLRKMRDLVNEICLWASIRLKDKRWSRLTGGMKVASEISDFNNRIAKAKELFRDLSIITFASGFDAILAVLRLLLLRHDNISMEIDKIRQNQARQMDYLLDEFEARKEKEERQKFLASTLSPVTVTNPTYTEQGKLPCDEGTRVEVLSEILRWVSDISGKAQSFVWLSGDPGCGKSAITASIARACKDQGTLWAQFFINRNNEETTNPNYYFPSIAQQLITRSTEVEMAVYDTLKAKPSLLDRITPEQAAKLFIHSIRVATELNPRKPVVIVIDGLDETDHRCLRDTAIIFSCLFRGLAPFPNAKVFVSSRTEDEIRNPFAKNMKTTEVKHIHLDTLAQSSIDDVAIFLRRRLAQIVEQNDLDWNVWPGERRMAALASRASGLFIWAVTVSKFLDQQIAALGTECLDEILDVLSGDALADINTLYSVILRLTYKGQTDPWEFSKFRRIVGAILTLKEPLSLQQLSTFLDLRRTSTSAPVDVVRFVQRLRTVLVAGTEAVHQGTIPRVHKSFFEYITSSSPDPRFTIDLRLLEGELGLLCFRRLADASISLKSDPNLPPSLSYAYRHWSSHLEKSVGSCTGALVVSSSLNHRSLSNYLTSLPNDGPLSPFHLSHSPDHSLFYLTSTTSNQSWHFGSGRRGLVATIQAQTAGITAISFQQRNKGILCGSSKDPKLLLRNLTTGVNDSLGLLNLARLSGVTCLCHHRSDTSGGGELFAVGFENGEIRLWVAETRELVAFPAQHASAVRCLAFGSNGESLLSGSDDGTLRPWSIRGPQIFPRHLLVRHDEAIIFATITSDRQLIAASSDGTVFLCSSQAAFKEYPSGAIPDVHVWKASVPGDRRISCVSFLPFHAHLCIGFASGGGSIITFDDVDEVKKKGLGFQLNMKKQLSSQRFGTIYSSAYSLDSRYLALGLDNGRIHILNPFTLDLLAPIDAYVHPKPVMRLAFSPRKDFFASVSEDMVVRVWERPDYQSTALAHTRLEGQGPSPWMVAFSADGRMVAAVSTVALHLWDSRNLDAQSSLRPVDNAEFRSIAFSSDSSLLVGVSTFGLYVWDTKTKNMVGSISHLFPSALSIVFPSYLPRTQFVTIEKDGLRRSCKWKLADGVVINIGAHTHALLDYDDLTPFRLSDQPVKYPGRQDGLFYRPGEKARQTEEGLWVCLEDAVLRIREDGSVSVVRLGSNPSRPTELTDDNERDEDLE